jgi:hypothetical protein
MQHVGLSAANLCSLSSVTFFLFEAERSVLQEFMEDARFTHIKDAVWAMCIED